MHPLLDSHPAQRTPARQDTSPAEAIAWLEDPQPPPPPLSREEQHTHALAEAIGWPVEHLQEAIAELTTYDPQKRRKDHGVPADLVGGV